MSQPYVSCLLSTACGHVTPLHASERVLKQGPWRGTLGLALAGKIRLYADRLVLTQWTLKGRVRHVIDLRSIEKVRWIVRFRRKAILRMHCKNKHVVLLNIKNAGAWKYSIEEQCRKLGNGAPAEQRWWSTTHQTRSLSLLG